MERMACVDCGMPLISEGIPFPWDNSPSRLCADHARLRLLEMGENSPNGQCLILERMFMTQVLGVEELAELWSGCVDAGFSFPDDAMNRPLSESLREANRLYPDIRRPMLHGIIGLPALSEDRLRVLSSSVRAMFREVYEDRLDG